jgi:hypothetical protein
MSTSSAVAGQPRDAHELASEIELHKTFVMGYMLALTPLMDPSLPLLDYYVQRHGQSHVSPAVIYRNDGSMYSMEPMKAWLSRAAASGGGGGLGLGPDLLTLAMLSVMTRIGDQMDRKRLDLYDKNVPITQFVRHLRNASAHGNRWNFKLTKQGQEPRYPASCRRMVLKSSMDGKRAVWGGDGLIGPGDFFDILDELVAYLRTLPNLTGHKVSPIPVLPPPPPPDPSEPYVDPSDVAALHRMFDIEMPGWRERFGEGLGNLDADALREIIIGARAYLQKVIEVTESGGLSTGALTADQAVHAFAKNAAMQLNAPPQSS